MMMTGSDGCIVGSCGVSARLTQLQYPVAPAVMQQQQAPGCRRVNLVLHLLMVRGMWQLRTQIHTCTPASLARSPVWLVWCTQAERRLRSTECIPARPPGCCCVSCWCTTAENWVRFPQTFQPRQYTTAAQKHIPSGSCCSSAQLRCVRRSCSSSSKSKSRRHMVSGFFAMPVPSYSQPTC